jgi:CRISPR/Cas system-associated exonuclease Cas4 (RecB family)
MSIHPIIILIGLPGAGKTTVSGHLAAKLKARHISIEQYRDTPVAAADVIAGDLAAVASVSPLVFECSGASEDFEEIVAALSVQGISCFVVYLEVTPATALRRLASRIPYVAPKVQGDWTDHVSWVGTRLRLVPTDLDVDGELLGAEAAAAVVVNALTSRQTSHGSNALSQGTITFSQFHTWQVCGREYEYRNILRLRPTADLSPIVDAGSAAHEALAWLFTPGSATNSLEALLDVFDARMVTTSSPLADDARSLGRKILSQFYAAHYSRDDAKTLAVEKQISLPLHPHLSFAGRLDRLSLSPAGILEVTEFKLRETQRGARPRIPELLQPAAYAAAEMMARGDRSAFVRLHFLEQNRIERIALNERGARNVRLALLRWLAALQRRGLDAQPGSHCRRCGYRLVCPYSTAK